MRGAERKELVQQESRRQDIAVRKKGKHNGNDIHSNNSKIVLQLKVYIHIV